MAKCVSNITGAAGSTSQEVVSQAQEAQEMYREQKRKAKNETGTFQEFVRWCASKHEISLLYASVINEISN